MNANDELFTTPQPAPPPRPPLKLHMHPLSYALDERRPPRLLAANEIEPALVAVVDAKDARIAKLREALIEIARNAGGLVDGNVSDDFLAYLPKEIRLLRQKLDTAENRLKRIHTSSRL